MNTLNYTLKEQEIQEIQRKYKEIKKEIIKEFEKLKLLKRKRVLKSYSVLLKAVFLYIIKELSFQRISDRMASSKYRICMSDNAWRKQINKAALVFFPVAIQYLGKRHRRQGKKKPKTIFGFSEICVLDATSIAVEGKSTEVFRLHTNYSLNKHIPYEVDITDSHSAETVKHYHIERKTLYLADRAYGKTTQFSCIIDHNADFIFRMAPHNVKLFSDKECTKKIDFKKLVRKRAYSVICYFKEDAAIYKIRVIMAPIPSEKYKKTEKRTRRKAQKNQRKISEDTLELSKWLFLATTLPMKIKSKDILNTYRKRWQIELFFKRAKSLLHFHRLKRSSDKYMRAMLRLWFSVTAFISIVSSDISDSLRFKIPDFYLFDLVSSLFS